VTIAAPMARQPKAFQNVFASIVPSMPTILLHYAFPISLGSVRP
jgi:hypothetical protein